MTLNESSAQTSDKYADQLFFGMLSNNPDTTIKEFIKKYVPVALKKYDSDGKWIAYPPDFFEEPKFDTVTNSYIFYRHPYFNGQFKLGQLTITQKIYKEVDWSDNITDVKLSFEFDDKEEAENSYKKLVDTFSGFNVLKRQTSNDGIYKAEFTDKNSDKYYSRIQIILAKDNFSETRYIIPTSNGQTLLTKNGYKILIKVGNDLY